MGVIVLHAALIAGARQLLLNLVQLSLLFADQRLGDEVLWKVDPIGFDQFRIDTDLGLVWRSLRDVLFRDGNLLLLR